MDRTGDVQTATLLYTVGRCYEEFLDPITPVSPRSASVINEARFFNPHFALDHKDSAYLEAL